MGNNKNKLRILCVFVVAISIVFVGLMCEYKVNTLYAARVDKSEPVQKIIVDIEKTKPFEVINDNQPDFTVQEIVTTSYEKYGDFDSLGRCTSAMACIGLDMLPTQPRESLIHVYPTGWHTVQYDIVEGKYLYNRCHLIGYQLTGENANKYNLITGTRYMNVDGMLPFEDMVADYIKDTGNHVMYRVTPMFVYDNLIASGVQMEALSVEDNGKGIQFNVFVHNIQPGILIDYATGESSLK